MGGRAPLLIIGVEGLAEIVQLIPADGKPGGQRVPAKAQQMLRTGGERFVQVKAAVAAAGAFALLAGKADHNGRQGKPLGQTGGGNADDPLMPAVAGKHDGPIGNASGQLGLSVFPDFRLYVLPLPVQLAQLSGQVVRLPGIVGHQKPDGLLHLAQPPGGVQPGRQTKADGRGCDAPAVQSRMAEHGFKARAGRLLQLSQPPADQIAVFLGKGHYVRHGAHRNQIGVTVQHRLALAFAGTDQLQRHAHAG